MERVGRLRWGSESMVSILSWHTNDICWHYNSQISWCMEYGNGLWQKDKKKDHTKLGFTPVFHELTTHSSAWEIYLPYIRHITHSLQVSKYIVHSTEGKCSYMYDLVITSLSSLSIIFKFKSIQKWLINGILES